MDYVFIQGFDIVGEPVDDDAVRGPLQEVGWTGVDQTEEHPRVDFSGESDD